MDTEAGTDTESTGRRGDPEARIRDPEGEVYGHDSNERSACRQAVVDVKLTVVFLDDRLDDVSVDDVYPITDVIVIERDLAERASGKSRRQGEVYQPTGRERSPAGRPTTRTR